ncbi:MAG TPA: DUF3142 domain-containing protein [Candidatus Aquilonibacter sp.]|nr:DUF3142 domain-containing protein [Candidatus Aquilonibacter sp.]
MLYSIMLGDVRRRWIGWVLAVVIVGAGAWCLHRWRRPLRLEDRVAAPMQGEPRTMLWAWETPEDLRGLDVSRAGVAFLAGELRVGANVTVRPRMQPLLLPNGAWVMAVVRVEPTAEFADSAALREKTARAIIGLAAQKGVRGVQVDFDATATQRDFYAAVLREVRRELPQTMPLSMTALVSWCGEGSWLRSLPVEEAVPMFFRMGGPASERARRARSQNAVRAKVCAGSVGVSTDETWPAIGERQRVYVFRPGAWTKEEIARVNGAGYVGLEEVSSE